MRITVLSPKLKTIAVLLASAVLTLSCGDDAFLDSTIDPSAGTGTGGGGGGGSSGIDSTGIIQLTATPLNSQGRVGTQPKLSGNGLKVIFSGSYDPLGMNSDSTSSGYSYELFIVNADGTGLAQLTDAAGYGVIGGLMDLTYDGSKIVFTSEADYVGTNLDGNQDVYIMNSDGTGMLQLSPEDPGHVSQAPSITGDGATVAFISSADPFGTNPTNKLQIFTISANGTGLTQLTSFSTSVSRLHMSSDGSKIAFMSSADPLGTNVDASDEIYVINSDGTGLKQLTNSTLDSDGPRISGDGSIIIFSSNADLDPGKNPGGIQLFKINSDGTGLQQLTNGTSNVSWLGGIDISDDGTTIVFNSTDDLTGENPITVGMVFAYVNGSYKQVNPAHSVNEDTYGASVSSTGSRVVFTSRVDYTGGNPNGYDELYIATSY